jgi:hypothetical protein
MSQVTINISSIHNFIQPFIFQILATNTLSHSEFMQVYSAVYRLSSTPHRNKLLQQVQQDVYQYLLNIPDDYDTFYQFWLSSKLLNKALRHLSIGSSRSVKVEVYQVCMRSWINAGKPCYPEPGVVDEDDGYLKGLVDQLGSVAIL